MFRYFIALRMKCRVYEKRKRGREEEGRRRLIYVMAGRSLGCQASLVCYEYISQSHTDREFHSLSPSPSPSPSLSLSLPLSPSLSLSLSLSLPDQYTRVVC
jgi:hypothetical protein